MPFVVIFHKANAFAFNSMSYNGCRCLIVYRKVQKSIFNFIIIVSIDTLYSDALALVDDDHRIDAGYLSGIEQALENYPQSSMFCGRILPDWDGSEPGWVHDTGPYRIYPLPVPRFDLGAEPHEVTPQNSIPGGGNLVVRREVFDRVGRFSTELGPRGRSLGGSEDTDFVLRALAAGEHMQYLPDIVQYHYVDRARLQLGYLLRKSYERSRSIVRVRSDPQPGIPLYLWRKLTTYAIRAILSLSWPRTRFFLVRVAAVLGEMKGLRDTNA